jgi:hypothetical protein
MVSKQAGFEPLPASAGDTAEGAQREQQPRRLSIPTSTRGGSSCPADVAGKHDSSYHAVGRHDATQCRPMDVYTMPPWPGTEGQGGSEPPPISAACASEGVVVLASGGRLAGLRRTDHAVLWGPLDVTEGTGCARGGTVMMDLQPLKSASARRCVAVSGGVHAGIVSVWDMGTGDMVHRLEVKAKDYRAHVTGVKYSHDGSQVVVSHYSGTDVYMTETGVQRHSFHGRGVSGAAIDASGTFLGVTGPRGTGGIIDLTRPSGAQSFQVRPLESIGDADTCACCFDDGSAQFAYTTGANTESCVAVLREKVQDGTWRVKWREKISGKAERILRIEFSPGDGRYLLIVSLDDGDKAGHGGIVILDSYTGKEHAWSRCFRARMLPPGGEMYYQTSL